MRGIKPLLTSKPIIAELLGLAYYYMSSFILDWKYVGYFSITAIVASQFCFKALITSFF
jgi:hypothetical protein